MFRFVLLILSLLFLTACGPNGLPYKYRAENFREDEKGIVITRLSEYDAQALGKTDINLNYRLRKIGQEGTYFIEANNSLLPSISNKYDYAQNILMLDPGIYYLDYIQLLGSNSMIMWYPSPGIENITKAGGKERLIFKYGAFKVNAGDVIYLGHLHLGSKGELPFKVINEIEKAKADLNKKTYTNLAQKLRPSEFYQSGSFYLEQNKKGEGLIISRKKIDEMRAEVVNKIADKVLNK